MHKEFIGENFGDFFECVEQKGGTFADITIAIAKKKINTSSISSSINKGDKIAIKSPKGRSSSSRDRIRGEITVFEAMKENPYIVKYYGWLERSSMPVILLECAETDLYNWKHTKYDKKDIPEGLKDSILERICKGLSAIHNITGPNKEKYLHRDICPQNIFVFGSELEGIVKIGDLGSAGIARAKDDNPNKGTVTLSSMNFHGKDVYSAPEVMLPFNKQERVIYGIPTEVYSLGLVALFLECGETPFEQDGIEEKFDELKAAKENTTYLDKKMDLMLRSKSVSEDRIKAIRKAIDPDPTNRQQSVQEFLDDYQRGSILTPLETYYERLEDLLNQPKTGLYKTVEMQNVDAAINIYEKMVAYEQERKVTSSLTQKAYEELKRLAIQEHNIFLNKTTEMCNSIAKGKKEFTSERDKKDFIEKIGTKVHVWGNQFGVDFISRKYAGRVSPNDPELDKRIIDYFK